jgi:cutinase
VVAHKALQGLDKTSTPALKLVAGLVTFGDPNHVWDNLPLPRSIPSSSFSSYCVTGSVFDPLCAHLPQAFKIPTSVNDIIGPFKTLPTVAVGAQEAEAAASLIVNFPGQLLGTFTSFIKALRPSQFVRLLLTPEHFTYGNNGMAKTAAGFVANLPAVKAAIAKGGK